MNTTEYIKNIGTHEVSVTIGVGSTDVYYMVVVDCIDDDGMHVRSRVISRHESRDEAVRNAVRLAEIIEWGRG